MLKPTQPGKNNPALERLLKLFGGEFWPDYQQAIQNKPVTSSQARLYQQAIDAHFYQKLKEVYNLDRTDPESFFEVQQGHARAVIEDVLEDYTPSLKSRIGIRNEVTLTSRPSEIYRRLAMSTADITPELQFEVQRHLVLSLTAAEINARSTNEQLRHELSGVQSILNDHLFSGPEGYAEDYTVYACFDNDTNRTSCFFVNGCTTPKNSHKKAFRCRVRFVDGTGHVYTDPRIKDTTSAILKTTRKAVNNGQVMEPLNDVKDSMGMMFTVMDENAEEKSRFSQRERLVNQVRAAIQYHPNGIEQIKEDNDVEQDRGQATGIQFTRLQIQLLGLGLPIELMVFDAWNYLNSRYEVGVKNPDTGLYDGGAHELYKIRRVADVLSVYFPQELYRVDTLEALRQRGDQVAQDLLNKDRV